MEHDFEEFGKISIIRFDGSYKLMVIRNVMALVALVPFEFFCMVTMKKGEKMKNVIENYLL